MGQGSRYLFKASQYLLLAAGRGQFLFRQGVQEFQLLGVTAKNPRLPARPGGKGGVPLLGARATITAIVHIKDGFVRDPPAPVIDIASLSEIDVVAACRFAVLQHSRE